MKAPSFMNPLFAEMIERHTRLIRLPGNGSEGLSGSQEIGLTNGVLESRPIAATLQSGGDVPSAQSFHYVLLEEGELLQPGDEFWDEELGNWFQCNADPGGRAHTSLGIIYRRKEPRIPTQYLHYPLLCLALLEENAILKRRLEAQARVEAEMLPK